MPGFTDTNGFRRQTPGELFTICDRKEIQNCYQMSRKKIADDSFVVSSRTMTFRNS